MLVHDRLTVNIWFMCHTASDGSRAVMLLMCGLIFRFLSLVHVCSFMNTTRDMHSNIPSVCLSLCCASDVCCCVFTLLFCLTVVN